MHVGLGGGIMAYSQTWSPCPRGDVALGRYEVTLEDCWDGDCGRRVVRGGRPLPQLQLH